MTPAFLVQSQGMRRLYSRMLTPLLERYRLTQLEMDILLFLANNPEHDTARDMVELRHLAKSHVSAGVDSLVRRGLVERFFREGNRKVIHLRLLPAAAEPVAAGREVQRAVRRGPSGGLYAGGAGRAGRPAGPDRGQCGRRPGGGGPA